MTKRENTEINVLDKIEKKVITPKLYKVIMLNDHYTPMDFVVDILRDVFHKNSIEATKIMLDIHKKGRALAGIYEYDIALTKIKQVETLSHKEEYPLKCILESK